MFLLSQAATAAVTEPTDWGVVAAAAGTFITTVVITAAGWIKGKEKLETEMSASLGGPNVSSVIVQDNQSVRDATLAQVALRDQLFLLNQQLPHHTEALRDNNRSLENICEELTKLVKILKDRG